MNPLYGIGNPELLGIDISEGTLKIAHIKNTVHKGEVFNLVNRDITGLSNEDISRIIKGYINEVKAKNIRIINIVPSHLVITKNIEIPSTKLNEINEIINLQAGRHTPYSREEIIVDYINIGTHKQNYTKILLVIVASNVVKRQIEILGSMRVNLEKIALASEGLAIILPRLIKGDTKSAPVNLIHVDDRFSDFVIVFKNKPIFARSIHIGTLHIIEDREKYMSRFVEETQRSLEAYQSEDIEKIPNRLVLTGAVDKIKELETILRDNLHLPISAVPYFQNLTISNRALKTIQEAKYSSFLNVIAPVLAREDLKVNLLPEEIKLTKALEARGRELIKTGIYILAFFILIFSILIVKIHFKSTYLGKLNKGFGSLGKEVQDLGAVSSKINLIKKYLASRGYSLEVLTELYRVIPLDLKISEIKYTAQDEFSIKGTAGSMSTVFTFVDNMEKSEYFKDVKTRYTTKRKEGSKDLTDFEIICLLEK